MSDKTEAFQENGWRKRSFANYPRKYKGEVWFLPPLSNQDFIWILYDVEMNVLAGGRVPSLADAIDYMQNALLLWLQHGTDSATDSLPESPSDIGFLALGQQS